MAIKIGKTVYRNIQEQVLKNKEDIEEIAKKIPYPSTEYYNKDEIDAKLAEYYNKDEVADILLDYYDKDAVDSKLDDYYTKTEIDSILASYALKSDLPTQRYLHRLFFNIDSGSTYVALNLITTSDVKWTLGNLPNTNNDPIDITATSLTLTGSYEFTLNVSNNDIQILNQSGSYLVDFEGVTSVNDRVQPL